MVHLSWGNIHPSEKNKVAFNQWVKDLACRQPSSEPGLFSYEAVMDEVCGLAPSCWNILASLILHAFTSLIPRMHPYRMPLYWFSTLSPGAQRFHQILSDDVMHCESWVRSRHIELKFLANMWLVKLFWVKLHEVNLTFWGCFVLLVSRLQLHWINFSTQT